MGREGREDREDREKRRKVRERARRSINKKHQHTNATNWFMNGNVRDMSYKGAVERESEGEEEKERETTNV